MFKGFQDTLEHFNRFPNIVFGTGREAYSFGGAITWFDAELRTNTRTDAAAISRWEDKFGYVFIQPTAGNQPRLQLNNAGFNNRSTIDFYAQTRHLYSSGGFALDPNYTLAMVYKKNTNSTGTLNRTTLLGSAIGVGASRGLSAHLANDATPEQVGFHASNASFSYSTPDAYGSASIILVINRSSIIVNGAIASTINGSNFAGFSCIVMSNSTNLTSGTIEIAEIIVFNRMLNSQQMIQLSNNLNNKYAIY